MFSQQEDWQMTNWIFLLLFRTFHKCWLISIVWIVFIQLSSSSGKMPGISNLHGMHSASKYLSSVVFKINTVGQSSSWRSWLSLLLRKYLQTLSLIPTTPRVFSVELETLSSTFILTLLQSAVRRACPFKPSMTVYLSWDDALSSLAYYEINFSCLFGKKKSFLNFAWKSVWILDYFLVLLKFFVIFFNRMLHYFICDTSSMQKCLACIL